MELKLTTVRALQFEERTGKDIVTFMKSIADTGEVTVRDVVELFKALGENYTVEVFDAWDASFSEKASAIVNAVAEYMNMGKGKK